MGNPQLRLDGVGTMNASSFNLAPEASTQGTGAGRSKTPILPDVVVTREVDGDSPKVFKKNLTGDQLKSVEIAQESGGHCVRVQMEDVLVSSYALGGAGGAAAYEQFTLHASKVKVSVVPGPCEPKQPSGVRLRP